MSMAKHGTYIQNTHLLEDFTAVRPVLHAYSKQYLNFYLLRLTDRPYCVLRKKKTFISIPRVLSTIAFKSPA